MRVFYSEDVEGDLDTIADYIAVDNPLRAPIFIAEIYATIRRIGNNPFHYQLRPDIGPDARLAVIGRYVILFRVGDEGVYVERVVHGSRDLPTLYH